MVVSLESVVSFTRIEKDVSEELGLVAWDPSELASDDVTCSDKLVEYKDEITSLEDVSIPALTEAGSDEEDFVISPDDVIIISCVVVLASADDCCSISSLEDGCILGILSLEEVQRESVESPRRDWEEGPPTIDVSITMTDNVTSMMLLVLGNSTTEVLGCMFITLEPSPEAMLEESTMDEESSALAEVTISARMLTTVKESGILVRSAMLVELKESAKRKTTVSVKTRKLPWETSLTRSRYWFCI